MARKGKECSFGTIWNHKKLKGTSAHTDWQWSMVILTSWQNLYLNLMLVSKSLFTLKYATNTIAVSSVANVSRVPPATAVQNKPNTKEELGHYRRSLWDQGCHLQHNAGVMTCLCSTVCDKKMPNVMSLQIILNCSICWTEWSVANPWFPTGFWLVRPRVLVPVCQQSEANTCK